MSGLSPYGRLEKAIAAADTGMIRHRWEYGRRLLCDPSVTTADGNLRHGAIADLVEQAHKAGRRLSEREIRYRLAAGRAYPCESQIRHAGADFDTWTALRDAGFPACEPGPGEEPFDPRSTAEKARAVDKQLHLGDPDQLVLFEYFPPDRFTELSTLAELAKYAAEMADMTRRYAERDKERAAYLARLTTAVDGDLTRTWAEAQAALDEAT